MPREQTTLQTSNHGPPPLSRGKRFLLAAGVSSAILILLGLSIAAFLLTREHRNHHSGFKHRFGLRPTLISKVNSFQQSPRNGVFLQAATGYEVSEMIDLSIFQPFEPGITPAEAVSEFGEPRYQREGKYYDDWEYLGYEGLNARIEVAYEPSHSWPGTHHRRTLYAYPKSPDGHFLPGELLSSAVRAHLPKSGQEMEMILTDSAGLESVWCVVRDSSILSVNWACSE